MEVLPGRIIKTSNVSFTLLFRSNSRIFMSLFVMIQSRNPRTPLGVFCIGVLTLIRSIVMKGLLEISLSIVLITSTFILCIGIKNICSEANNGERGFFIQRYCRETNHRFFFGIFVAFSKQFVYSTP